MIAPSVNHRDGDPSEMPASGMNAIEVVLGDITRQQVDVRATPTPIAVIRLVAFDQAGYDLLARA